MGVPVTDDERSGATAYCEDSLTFQIVGKNAASVSRAVSNLYKALTEAKRFGNAESAIPVYLEIVPNEAVGEAVQTRTLWAVVLDFDFHELNDPLDSVNGNVIRDATLAIKRTVWGSVPPQESPNAFSYPVEEDGLATSSFDFARVIISQSRWRSTGVWHNPTYGFDEHKALYTNNHFRQNNIDYVANLLLPNAVNIQPTVFVNDYPFGNLATTLNVSFGSVQRFNAIAVELGAATGKTMSDLNLAYWNGSAWITIPKNKITDFFDLGSTGQKYIQWVSPEGDWVKENVNGMNAYWVKLLATPSSGSFTTQPRQDQQLIHTPSLPYVDVVEPVGGDVNSPLAIRIIPLEPWKHVTEDPEMMSTQYNKLMDSVIIASSRLIEPDRHVQDPGVGFYTLAQDATISPATLSNGAVWQQNPMEPGSFAAYPFSESTDGHYVRIIKMNVPARPGAYRIFVRYRVTAPGTQTGRISFRVAVSEALKPETVDLPVKSIKTAPHNVNLDAMYAGHTGTTLLADMGVVSLAPDVLRNPIDMPYSVGLSIEVKTADFTQGKLAFVDVITLPVNEYYTVIEGQRPILPIHHVRNSGVVNREDAAKGVLFQPVYLAEDLLHITGMPHVGTRAYVSSSHTWGASRRAIATQLAVIGGGNMTIEPDYGRRFWFLWYKRQADGVVYSDISHKAGVQMFASRNYITLPPS
jgi:hypothetical protein